MESPEFDISGFSQEVYAAMDHVFGMLTDADWEMLPGPTNPYHQIYKQQFRRRRPQSLRLIRHETPSGVGQGRDQEVWDVFISHASEDKGLVARPLAEALQAHGLSVWLDDFELKIGDSLRRKIDAGVANSKFSVVVLSHTSLRRTGLSTN